MARQISRIVILTICTLMGLAAAQAMANDYQHINQLARKIHHKSRILLNETRHYRSTPNYVRLVRDVAELDQASCHLRDIARNEGDLDHMAADIAKMDCAFHHIEELFDATELSASYGNGFIKGHTAHVKRLLNSIEDAIHHIGEDIEQLRSITPIAVSSHNANPFYPNLYQRSAVTRVETYRLPSNSFHYGSRGHRGYSPYGGSTLHRGYGYNDLRLNDHRNNNHAGGFSFGGGSSRMTFRF